MYTNGMYIVQVMFIKDILYKSCTPMVAYVHYTSHVHQGYIIQIMYINDILKSGNIVSDSLRRPPTLCYCTTITVAFKRLEGGF